MSASQWELSVGAFTLGVALVVVLAIRPTLANLLARLQVAATKPFKVGDQLMTDTMCGRIEDITSTYVVLNVIEKRRVFIPLSYLLQHPFQNLSRQNTQFVTELTLQTDQPIRLEAARTEFLRVLGASERWDCRVADLNLAGTNSSAAELRCSFSAANARDLSHLRLEVREKLRSFLQERSTAPERRQFDFTSLSAPMPRLAHHKVRRDRNR